MRRRDHVTVDGPAPSRDVGGCNACTRHVTADGGTDHDVWRIRGGDHAVVELRLCAACLAALCRHLAAD